MSKVLRGISRLDQAAVGELAVIIDEFDRTLAHLDPIMKVGLEGQLGIETLGAGRELEIELLDRDLQTQMRRSDS